MARIRVLVAYDGTNLQGWQRQAPGKGATVAEALEKGLSKILQEDIRIYGSGRTDSGVHAMGQVFHFDSIKPEEHFLKWDLCWAIKNQLPPEIVVRKAWLAPDEFHSLFSAEKKTYKYFIYNAKRSNPFWRRYSAWINKPLDLGFLGSCTDHIIGTHDFKSFQSVGTAVKSTVRQIHHASWRQRSRNIVEFSISGDGFLKQMVRNIVGTSLYLYKENRQASDMTEILHALDRTKAGPPADPEGLFLWKVYYPDPLDNKCRPL